MLIFFRKAFRLIIIFYKSNLSNKTKVYICNTSLNLKIQFQVMTADLNAFNQFFLDYQQRFIYFAHMYIHDEALAEDLVIEAMMYYWENIERLPDDINIPAYVLTALKHKCIDYLRHQQISRFASDKISELYSWELSTRINSLEELEPNEIFAKEIQEIVHKTLTTLPEQTRRIFVMSRHENKTHKEIADLLGMTPKGVEFHISKATRLLRHTLKDYLPTSLLFFYFC